MKILIAGRWRSNIHEEPIYKILKKNNIDVQKFKWKKYLENRYYAINLLIKLINKYLPFLVISIINYFLVKKILRYKPHILFIYRGNVIKKKTLQFIKKNKDLILISYNNDNPFSYLYPKKYWNMYNESISEYDLVFSYRKSNISDYVSYGAKNVKLLPPWFIKDSNKEVIISEKDKNFYQSDIVFVGHYENDGRLELFRKIKSKGYNIKIFGPGWNKYIKNDSILKELYPIKYLYENDYNKAFCASKISIVFYSTLNLDNYTRKCFEIPATKSFMIVKRNKEILSLFDEGKEVICYNNVEELFLLFDYYLQNPEERNRIAENAYKRIFKSGYEAEDRIKFIMSCIDELIKNDHEKKFL